MEFNARDRLKLLGGASALLLSACGGGGGTPAVSIITPPPPPPPPPPATGNGDISEGFLRNKFRNHFTVGVSLTTTQINSRDKSAALALSQFNGVTPEYQMKPDIIAPREGEYNFDEADRVIDWALANNMSVRGHALVWHEATPAYFFQGSRDDIKSRLESYITTVVNHFKGRVDVWDVVNEAISTDIYDGANGVGPDRRTSWYDAVGNADYLDWAFLAARAADPSAKLFLSDYNTENPIKQGWLVEILRRFRDRNIPIDGVGHQFHLQLNTSPDAALSAIEAVDNEFAGLINHITELDLNLYRDPGTCYESETNCEADIGPNPPADLLADQAQLMRDVFDRLVTKPSVESVTFWGVRDGDSWLNHNPVERYNFPLLFDRDGEPKPVFYAITDPNYEI